MSLFEKKDRLLLIAAVILGGINAFLSAFVSILLQKVIDIAAMGSLEGFTGLIPVMLIYLLALGIIGLLEAFAGKLLLRNVSMHLRDRLFHGIINHRPQEYLSHNTADYLSALINDVKLVEENYLTPLLLCSQMTVLFLTTLGILFYLSPLVTLALLVLLALMFLIPALLGKQLQNRQDAYSGKLADFTARVKDYLNGYEVIRGYSMFPYIFRLYKKSNRETADRKLAADSLLAVNECLSDILSALSSLSIVFLAAYLLLTGRITMGTLMALVQLSATFITPVVVLMQNAPKISGIKPIMERLAEYIGEGPDNGGAGNHGKSSGRGQDVEPAADIVRRKTSPVMLHSSLDCRNITFHYRDQQRILDHLELHLEAGGKYALLGESGSGKTTLVRLLTGCIEDFQGDILYDGVSIRQMDQTAINRMVAVIHQNVFLFDTDIYDNICLGEEFTEEQLEDALVKSGTALFLPGLENGIRTKAGENGRLLSGGQRQRIALARALIRHTPILILDEATSAVDQETAHEIERSLLAREELTVLTITHHLDECLRPCYRQVFQLEHGRLQSLLT